MNKILSTIVPLFLLHGFCKAVESHALQNHSGHRQQTFPDNASLITLVLQKKILPRYTVTKDVCSPDELKKLELPILPSLIRKQIHFLSLGLNTKDSQLLDTYTTQHPINTVSKIEADTEQALLEHGAYDPKTIQLATILTFFKERSHLTTPYIERQHRPLSAGISPFAINLLPILRTSFEKNTLNPTLQRLETENPLSLCELFAFGRKLLFEEESHPAVPTKVIQVKKEKCDSDETGAGEAKPTQQKRPADEDFTSYIPLPESIKKLCHFNEPLAGSTRELYHTLMRQKNNLKECMDLLARIPLENRVYKSAHGILTSFIEERLATFPAHTKKMTPDRYNTLKALILVHPDASFETLSSLLKEQTPQVQYAAPVLAHTATAAATVHRKKIKEDPDEDNSTKSDVPMQATTKKYNEYCDLPSAIETTIEGREQKQRVQELYHTIMRHEHKPEEFIHFLNKGLEGQYKTYKTARTRLYEFSDSRKKMFFSEEGLQKLDATAQDLLTYILLVHPDASKETILQKIQKLKEDAKHTTAATQIFETLNAHKIVIKIKQKSVSTQNSTWNVSDTPRTSSSVTDEKNTSIPFDGAGMAIEDDDFAPANKLMIVTTESAASGEKKRSVVCPYCYNDPTEQNMIQNILNEYGDNAIPLQIVRNKKGWQFAVTAKSFAEHLRRHTTEATFDVLCPHCSATIASNALHNHECIKKLNKK